MYDRNGLQLSPVAETMNSYRLTAVDLKNRKYSAYAMASRPKGPNQWAMFPSGTQFKDPRDAAYVAQEFEKHYSKEQVRQMHTDGVLHQVTLEFVENTEIPEWGFPAEGLLIEDILNDYGYKQNRVSSPVEALKEAIKVTGCNTPPLKKVNTLVSAVQEKYDSGFSYREAAMRTVKELASV